MKQMILFNAKRISYLISFLLFITSGNLEKYVSNQATSKSFPLASNGKTASILVSDSDFPGVLRVVGHFQNDINNVTGVQPTIFNSVSQAEGDILIVGTLGKSAILEQLVKNGKINASQLQGKREKFITQIIENPIAGIKRALVIAGSDKRGTIYGIYDLSNQIGVSPWYFWADVPIEKQSELHVLPGIHTLGEPKVKYRGIFINDEAPALTGWVYEKYGDFNSQFYERQLFMASYVAAQNV